MKHSAKTLALIPFLLPAAALAHPGAHAATTVSSHFLGGALHALSGLDHVIGALMGGACIAIALHKSAKTWRHALPVALLVALSFLFSAMLGNALPAAMANVAEWAVLASIVVMMAAITSGILRRGQPLAFAAMLVIALASCHAFAHSAQLATLALPAAMSFAFGACALLLGVAVLSALAVKRVLVRFTPVNY